MHAGMPACSHTLAPAHKDTRCCAAAPASRSYEPCGLVDVEAGWQGALAIAHDTGGLGKVPGGTYYAVEASHLGHLARCLEEAVDRWAGTG